MDMTINLADLSQDISLAAGCTDEDSILDVPPRDDGQEKFDSLLSYEIIEGASITGNPMLFAKMGYSYTIKPTKSNHSTY